MTARQGRPYVRRFVEERALTLRLIVDVSSSLRFGPEGRTKADRALQAAALLATAAVRNGDRVGLTLVSDRIEAELAPATGPGHLAQIIRAWWRPRPPRVVRHSRRVSQVSDVPGRVDVPWSWSSATSSPTSPSRGGVNWHGVTK